MTRADQIRNMSDSDLARFLCDISAEPNNGCGFCKAAEFCRVGHNGMIDFLQGKAEEEYE